MLGKIKSRIIRSVRLQCIKFMHRGQWEKARKLLKLVLGSKTDVLLVPVKPINGSFGDDSFLWKESYNTPVYDTTGGQVGEALLVGWVKKMDNCFIHHGTSAVLDRQQTTAYIDVTSVDDANHNHAIGVLEYYKQGRGIIVTGKPFTEIEKGIYIGGNASFNYYHFVVEIAARFYFLDKVAGYDNYPLLVDEVIIRTPQFKDLLDILNDKGRKIIVIQDKIKYLVKNLILASDGAKMVINVFDKTKCSFYDTILCAQALMYIRSKVISKLGLADQPATPEKHLFITRGAAFTRRGCNEDELWQVAERYAYSKIAPQNLSFSEQVACFHSCKSLLANSGAALTNILFMQPGTTVIYWLNQDLRHFTSFNPLAKISGCQLQRIDGVPTGNDKEEIHGYYYVDPKQVEAML